MNKENEISQNIKKMITDNEVVLFMKGDPDFPQCGFSANVVGILNHFNVKYKSYNVLQDNDLRQGIKDYSDWPTVPQIYIKNQFIGGCDILNEMMQNNEIEDLFKENGINYSINP